MNNLSDEQLLEVENEYWVNMWSALERLKENKDFKLLVEQGYLKDKAINGVSLLAQQSIVAAGKRPEIYEALVAISHFEDFLITVENLGSIPPEDDESEE